MIETRFKDTEIGKIPEDWSCVEIGKLTSLMTNGFVGTIKDQYVLKNEGVLYIQGFNVEENSFNMTGVKYVSHSFHNHHKRSCLKEGDLLTVQTGDIGVTTCVPKEYEGANCQALIISRFLTKYDSRFWSYYFNSRKGRKSLLEIETGSTMKHINVKDMIKVLVPVPENKLEQSRIASALTSIDNLISSLDKLIEKKKNIKQGTMQQLLTGKKRLKGFSEPWVEKQLGKIGYTFSGLTGKTKDDFGTGNAKYITFLNVLNNPILKPELFEEVVVKEGEKQNNCHKGDLFFNTSSETPEEVGICAMLNTEQESLYLNSFCFGYRLNDENIVPEYLAYYFRSNEGRKLMTVLAQGVTRYNMSKSAFNNAKIMMPTTSMEQRAIAEVLKSMDKEIDAIEIKKAKYESMKQGMMQQLLTGKIRLI